MAQLPAHQPEWIATAPLVVQRERRVFAPPAAVWERIADHETWPEWFTALKRVQVTGAAEGVGGQRVVSVPGATFGEVFTTWEPEARFAFAVISGPRLLAGMAESIVIEPENTGCKVTYTQGIEPARGFGWFWRLSRRRLSQQLATALDGLATRAEAEHAAAD